MYHSCRAIYLFKVSSFCAVTGTVIINTKEMIHSDFKDVRMDEKEDFE